MIVPDHWAEARRQHKTAGRQVTVRRYGWSLNSQAEASAQAQARAEAALQRILAGEKLPRREPKVAYNGADGVPIREEVLARRGEQVITRNAYGAHCLNSPDALFADVDFHTGPGTRILQRTWAGLAVASGLAGLWLHSWGVALGLLLVSLLAAAPLAGLALQIAVAAQGGAARLARKRLLAFLARHPAWNVRLYRTPAGYRLLATHQPFEASDSAVRAFFSAVSADPLYVRMCLHQRCFRARLSAKPWRIGITTPMRPRPGVWPVQPGRLPARTAWIADYEARAAAFAACRYVESLGSGVIHATLQPVIELHDRESRALTNTAPLA
jgi:hypothetical protein